MKKILFVCAENANRSQIAEAFFNLYAQKEKINFIAESAGTFPGSKINPNTLEVMEEIDISLSEKHPKKFLPEDIGKYEEIISFGCLAKNTFEQSIQDKIVQWKIDDTSREDIDQIRKTRDMIEKKIVQLIEELRKQEVC